MTETLEIPEDLKFGYVVDQVLLAAGDGDDADEYPDVLAAKGTVTFTPLTPNALVHGGDATIARQAVVARVGEDGRLVYNGKKGVWLVVGDYSVRYQLDGAKITDANIVVREEHTPEHPLVLARHIELKPTPSMKLVVNEQLYLETLGLVVEARGIADDLRGIGGGGMPAGIVPIFPTLAEAQAWEADNPGKTALTLEGPTSPDDTTPPSPGVLTVEPGHVSADLTVSGASDDSAVTGYAFRVESGAWSAWQAEPTFTAGGLSAATSYTFQHRVRDAAGNEATGVAVVRSTSALPPRSPEDVGGLLGSWDMNDAVVSSGVITSVPDSIGGKTLIAATAGPALVTDGGKRFAKFTAADSHRLRWTGEWGEPAPFTVCAIMKRGSVSGVAINTSAVAVETTGNGVSAGYGGVKTGSVLAQADALVLVTASLEAGSVTVRVGSGSQSAVGTTGDLGNNFTLGARSGGAGSLFTSPTVGRVWVHDRALSQADHDALTMWAQGEWGAQ